MLRNDSPQSGVPLYVIGNSIGKPVGTNTLYLSIYSPFALRRATIDGQTFPLLAERELGHNVYSSFVDIPPGTSRTISLDLTGIIDLSDGHYRFDYLPQILPNADHVEWSALFPRSRVIAATALGPTPFTVVTDTNSARTVRPGARGPWSVDLKLQR